MDFFRGIRAMLDAPRLHKRIKDLELQVERQTLALRDAHSKPTFYDVAQPFDSGPLLAALKERVVEDMAPMLKRHALDNLTKILYNETAGDGLPTGRVAMLGEYTMSGDRGYVVQAEVCIPKIRHVFTVSVPPRGDNAA